MMKIKPNIWQDQRAFTLIEILCVLVIMSVIVSVTFTRILQADEGAKQVAVSLGVSELSLRESMTWAAEKISIGTVDDDMIWAKLEKNIGPEYRWYIGPNQTGSSTLKFKDTAVSISRSVSTDTHPGMWKR
jgi:prepilin-type N-terminal cleavage/methylation domain-containing protein